MHRRPVRTLLNAAALLSLLLFITTATLLFASWRHAWAVIYDGAGERHYLEGGANVNLYDPYLQPFVLIANKGRLAARIEKSDGFSSDGLHWKLCHQTPGDDFWITLWARLPATDRWMSHPDPRKSGRNAGAIELSTPFWLPLATTAILPLSILASRRTPRPPKGTCVLCGYDLRATPNRCPECGNINPPPA